MDNSFEIYLDLNATAIRTPIPGRHPIVCPFVVKIGETWFPDANYDDFALAVLHQWLHGLEPLLLGEVSSVTLVFMAGPFAMRVAPAEQDRWTIECVQSDTNEVYARAECNCNLVMKEILLAFLAVLARVREAGLSNEGCNALESEWKQRVTALASASGREPAVADDFNVEP